MDSFLPYRSFPYVLFGCMLIGILKPLHAQQFSGEIGTLSTTEKFSKFSLQTSQLTNVADGAFGLETVCFNITHPILLNLVIYLVSPRGTTIPIAF